jgi:hypothetical protein
VRADGVPAGILDDDRPNGKLAALQMKDGK